MNSDEIFPAEQLYNWILRNADNQTSGNSLQQVLQQLIPDNNSKTVTSCLLKLAAKCKSTENLRNAVRNVFSSEIPSLMMRDFQLASTVDDPFDLADVVELCRKCWKLSPDDAHSAGLVHWICIVGQGVVRWLDGLAGVDSCAVDALSKEVLVLFVTVLPETADVLLGQTGADSPVYSERILPVVANVLELFSRKSELLLFVDNNFISYHRDLSLQSNLTHFRKYALLSLKYCCCLAGRKVPYDVQCGQLVTTVRKLAVRLGQNDEEFSSTVVRIMLIDDPSLFECFALSMELFLFESFQDDRLAECFDPTRWFRAYFVAELSLDVSIVVDFLISAECGYVALIYWMKLLKFCEKQAVKLAVGKPLNVLVGPSVTLPELVMFVREVYSRLSSLSADGQVGHQLRPFLTLLARFF